MGKRKLDDDLQEMKKTGFWAWVKANPKKSALMAMALVAGVLVLVALFTGTPLPPAAG